METLEAELQINIESIRVLSLQQFDTEHSFLKEIRNFLDVTSGNKILIIQTDFENGSLSAQLVASAKYSAVNEINKTDLNKASVFVFFITKLPRVEGGSSYVGFHGDQRKLKITEALLEETAGLVKQEDEGNQC